VIRKEGKLFHQNITGNRRTRFEGVPLRPCEKKKGQEEKGNQNKVLYRKMTIEKVQENNDHQAG